jgi:hypothetical protein
VLLQAWEYAQKITKRIESDLFVTFKTILCFLVALVILEVVRRAFYYVITGKLSLAGEKFYFYFKKFWYIVLAVLVIIAVGYGLGQWKENKLAEQKKSKSQINRTIKPPTSTTTPDGRLPTNTPTPTPPPTVK